MPMLIRRLSNQVKLALISLDYLWVNFKVGAVNLQVTKGTDLWEGA